MKIEIKPKKKSCKLFNIPYGDLFAECSNNELYIKGRACCKHCTVTSVRTGELAAYSIEEAKTMEVKRVRSINVEVEE